MHCWGVFCSAAKIWDGSDQQSTMSSTSEAAGNGQLEGMLDWASGAEDAAAPAPSCAAGIGTEDEPAVTKPCCIDCGALEAGGGGGGGCCPSD